MTLTPEEVREVIKDENRHLQEAVNRMATSMERFADTLAEQVAQTRANDEKFVRCHERIDDLMSRQDKTDQSLITITTDIIPDLERDVAINSFSSGKIWTIALTVLAPLLGGMWLILSTFSSGQSDDSKALIEVLNKLATSIGAGG